MKRFLVLLVVACAGCASQPVPAPQPVWRTVEQCDPNLLTLTGADLARGTTEAGAKAPKIIKRVAPIVPPYTGTHFVQTESIIDESGRVSAICRVSGEPELVESVLQAMRQWVFEPALVDGKPAKVRFSLTTKFQR